MNKIVSLIMLLLLVFFSSARAEKVYTLQEAYQSAISNNEVVKIAEENVVQSESRVDQARTYVFPRLIGRAGYTRYNEVLPEMKPDEEGFIFQPLTQLSAALVLTQPLYTGGRTFAALRTAKTMREVSTRDLSSTRQDMVLNVAAAYYGVLRAEKMMGKSRESVDRMERHKLVTEREASTRKTKANISNLLRARTLVSQARIFLTRDENNVKIARQKLTLLTKLPETAAVVEPDSVPEPHESFEELKSLALTNRDEYAASKLNINIAEESITLVKGAHRAQVYAEAAVQDSESHPATLTDGTIYYGGLRLQVPIFEGGLTKAELSEARSKRRQAELSLLYLERSIESDVYESYINYQTIDSVLKAVRIQYDDARSNFQAVENLFSQGLAPSLSLIDAQQALFIAEREMVNATYDHQLAILRLHRSIGMLKKQY